MAGGELAGLWPFESSVDEVTWPVFVNRGTFVIVFGEPIFPFRRAAARASYYLSKAADGYWDEKALAVYREGRPAMSGATYCVEWGSFDMSEVENILANTFCIRRCCTFCARTCPSVELGCTFGTRWSIAKAAD